MPTHRSGLGLDPDGLIPTERLLELWRTELGEIENRLQVVRIDVRELEARRHALRELIADAIDLKLRKPGVTTVPESGKKLS